jgi:hypothetical protein
MLRGFEKQQLSQYKKTDKIPSLNTAYPKLFFLTVKTTSDHARTLSEIFLNF